MNFDIKFDLLLIFIAYSVCFKHQNKYVEIVIAYTVLKLLI